LCCAVNGKIAKVHCHQMNVSCFFDHCNRVHS
jgi:hypothetical protein